MSKLTLKQQQFINELIKGKTQREAYKLAYTKCKASDKTIDEMASKLFNSHKVITRYNELHARLIAEAEDECIVSAKEILREIKSIACEDIKNFLDFRTEKTVVGYGSDGTPIFGYAPIVDIKDSRDINTKNVAEVSIGANGAFKFKMYCRDTALYKLADLLGIAKDQGQKTADNGLLSAIDKSAERAWDNDISEVQQETAESIDVVGRADDVE